MNIAFLAHNLKENLYHCAHFGFDSGKLIVKLFVSNYHNFFYFTTDFELVLSRLPGEVNVYHIIITCISILLFFPLVWHLG